MRISKENRSTKSMRLTRIGGAVAAALLFQTNHAMAYTDATILDSFDAVAAGVPVCASGIGTGVAFDGASLMVSCWESNVLERVTAGSPHVYNPAPVTVAGVSTGAGNGLGALSWDAGRQKVWACDRGANAIKLIDIATGAVAVAPPPVPVLGDCSYGVAYDASDDTLWVSDPDSETIYHYALNGSLIATTWKNVDMFSGYPVSGIAVCNGLQVSNFDGGEIFSVPKDLSSASGLFYDGHFFVSDMAVDGNTFPGVDALWVVDGLTQNERQVAALQLPTRCANVSPIVRANSPPVCTAARANVAELPANNKLMPISILGVTDPDGDPVTIRATSIRQDEVVKGNRPGARNVQGDGQLSPLAVRAERDGSAKTPGNGRVYHIGFMATDTKGGSCTGTARVCVPYEQGKKKAACIDGGPLYNSLVP